MTRLALSTGARVLLLNPPASRNVIRDYFCSKTAKALYTFPPATLITLSGILRGQFTLAVLDAVAERLDRKQALETIRAQSPAAIVAMVGAASWDEDRLFLGEIKRYWQGGLLLAVGDVLLENPSERLSEVPDLDAVLLDFISPQINDFLLGRRDGLGPNIVTRESPQPLLRQAPAPWRGEYQAGLPDHGLFPLQRYRFPFMLRRPMSTVLTDYGCPYRCGFCMMHALGFALRPLAEVIAELEALRRLGVREIFFTDQTFGARKDRTLALCDHLAQPNARFTWSCFSRADLLDGGMLSAMARAGCHTIMLGVESGSPEQLAAWNKQEGLEQIQAAIARIHAHRMRAAGTFILGLPGETPAQIQATIAWALRLPLDFASFNVAVPKPATRLRQHAVAEGLIPAEEVRMDQSGVANVWGTQQCSAAMLQRLHQEAIRRFYLRPAYLWKRLWGIRSWQDFLCQCLDGLQLLGTRKS